MDLKIAKEADNNITYLVFGYIRSFAQNTLTNSVIATDIYYLCVLFLFKYEYFDLIGKPQEVKVSKDRLTITNINLPNITSWNNTSYLKNSISSTSNKIITWRIKFFNLKNDETRQVIKESLGNRKVPHQFSIGVVSKMDSQSSDFRFGHNGYIYGIDSNGWRFEQYNDKFVIKCKDYKNNDFKSICYDGIIVIFVLNLKERKISVGSTKTGKLMDIYSNIKIDDNVSYNLAIGLPSYSNSATFIDLQQT